MRANSRVRRILIPGYNGRAEKRRSRRTSYIMATTASSSSSKEAGEGISTTAEQFALQSATAPRLARLQIPDSIQRNNRSALLSPYVGLQLCFLKVSFFHVPKHWLLFLAAGAAFRSRRRPLRRRRPALDMLGYRNLLTSFPAIIR